MKAETLRPLGICLALAMAPAMTMPAAAQEPEAPLEPPGEQAASADEADEAVPVPGVSEDRILFGQSAALSGETEALGSSMRLGLEAAFREAGQVHGREISLLALDDRYEPQDALDNTRALIEESNVFALVGAVGTPTTRAAAPLALEAGVPYVAPLTGADFLRQPQWHNVINLRASYFQETEEIVRYLVDELSLENIAVFYQDDSFGQAGYQGTAIALSRRGLQPGAIAAYPRNTRAVKSGLLEIRNTRPEAVIMVGSYRPVAEMVSWARMIDFNPVFMTLSFAGSNSLAEILGPRGAGVYVTQVVPFPWGDELPVLQHYRAALTAHQPDAEPGFVSLEGYLAGRLVVEVLRELGPELSRGAFMTKLNEMEEMDLAGFTLSFDENNQGSDTVFLTVIDEQGRYQPVQ